MPKTQDYCKSVIALSAYQKVIHGEHLFIPGLQHPVHDILWLVSYMTMFIGIVVNSNQSPDFLSIYLDCQLILRQFCCLQSNISFCLPHMQAVLV